MSDCPSIRWLVLRGFTLLFCCLLATPETTLAQVTTGEIGGTVKDESDAVLPGATASYRVTGASEAGPSTEITDENGQFRFRNLSPGLYVLKVTLDSFSPYQADNLRVQVGGRHRRGCRAQGRRAGREPDRRRRGGQHRHRHGHVDEHLERAVSVDADPAQQRLRPRQGGARRGQRGSIGPQHIPFGCGLVSR